MKCLNLFLSILILITWISCSNQDHSVSDPVSLACDKLTNREDAENLMAQVNDVRLADSLSIITNLIGEWGLIGTVQGWGGFETGQECFKLKISSNRIALEDLNSGNNNSSEWELKKIEVNGFIGFYLDTNEDILNNRMGMQIFSEDIMFGSGRVDDANIYIYEKLR